jgi:glutaredoxin-like protein NrdH
MNIEHVTGKDAGKIMLYALSTCGWCRKTKTLLSSMGVAYDFIDVDLVQGQEREEVLNKVKKWNPACSFPTLVINESKCIVGFDENSIKKEIKV